MTFEGEPVYTTSREAEAIYLAMLAARPAAPTQSAAQTGMLRVVAAAHKVDLTPEETGDPRAVPIIISAMPPARHHNLFACGHHPNGLSASGFLLSDGSFADRRTAAAVAIAAGQIKALAHPPYLYSEDLW